MILLRQSRLIVHLQTCFVPMKPSHHFVNFLTAWTRGVLIFKSSPISLSLGVINVDFACPSFNWMMYVCWGAGVGGEDISDTTSLYFTNSLKCFMRAHCQSVVQDVFLLTQMFSATCLTYHPYFYGFKIFWLDFMNWTIWNFLCKFTHMHQFLQHAAIYFQYITGVKELSCIPVPFHM